MSDFVDADTVRLDLTPGANGQPRWVEIKAELTWGEQKRLESSSLRFDAATQRFDVDLGSFDVNKLLAWLVDWNFRDRHDRAVPISQATIEALRPAAAREIEAAIEAHKAGMATEGNALIGSDAPEPNS